MLIHQLLLVLHIVAGSVALLLFCAVMAVAKGSPLHRRVGAWFYVVMHALTLSGIGMAVLVLLDPLAMKGAAQPVGVSSADYLRQVQLFWQFLLLLSLLALFNVRHGVRVLQMGTDRRGLSTPSHWLLFALTQSWALFTLWQSATQHFLLGQIFAMVAMVTGGGAARYLLKASVTPLQRIAQHIGNMMGCGIAIFTAFFALGGRTLIDVSPQAQLVFWLLPSVVGVVLIANYNRQWRRKLTKTMPAR